MFMISPQRHIGNLRMACGLGVVAMVIGALNAEPPPWAPSPWGGAGHSGESEKAVTADQLVRVETTADVESVGPGQKFNLLVAFSIEPHWHMYWKNPGSSGMETTIEVSAPKGFKVGAVRFPRPQKFQETIGFTYGYEDAAVMLIPVEAPAELETGNVAFSLEVSFLVCRGLCLMGSEEQTIVIPSDRHLGVPSRQTEKMERLLKRFPEQVQKGGAIRVSFEESVVMVDLPSRGMGKGEFFPLARAGVVLGEASFAFAGERVRITIPVRIEAQNLEGAEPRVAGLIGLGGSPDDPSYEFSLPLNPEDIHQPIATRSGGDKSHQKGKEPSP